MPRLTRLPRPTRRRGDDCGAVSTVVAVLLAGGVLLGMTALVVDVGRLYAEREELLTGADAAAMDVALDCAFNRSACTSAMTVAEQRADQNARDGHAAVTAVCGNDGQGRLPSCAAVGFTNLTECVRPRPTDGTRYVEVRTRTETVDGESILPPMFARALVPDYDEQNGEVRACSRVAWGAPAGGLAVTIGTCEWFTATQNGTVFAPAPPETPSPAATYEKVIRLHDPQDDWTCPAGPGGADAPGGFGWIDDGSPLDCAAVISGGQYEGDTGNNVSNACKTALSDARTNRTILLIPVYDDVQGTGNNTTYHLYGVAAFVVTGYHLPGFSEKSILTNANLCTGQAKCVYGYFVSAVVPWSGPLANLPYLGAVAVKTIG